jgi:hypothetical protein
MAGRTTRRFHHNAATVGLHQLTDIMVRKLVPSTSCHLARLDPLASRTFAVRYLVIHRFKRMFELRVRGENVLLLAGIGSRVSRDDTHSLLRVAPTTSACEPLQVTLVGVHGRR